jgi:hypothetical protein
MPSISPTLVSELPCDYHIQDQTSFKKFSVVGRNLKEISYKLDWEFRVKLSGAKSQDSTYW